MTDDDWTEIAEAQGFATNRSEKPAGKQSDEMKRALHRLHAEAIQARQLLGGMAPDSLSRAIEDARKALGIGEGE